PADVMTALEKWTTSELPVPPDEWMPRLCPAARTSTCEMDYDPTTPQQLSRPIGLRPGSKTNLRPITVSDAPTDRLLDAQANIDTDASLRRTRPTELKEVAKEVTITAKPPVTPSQQIVTVKPPSKPGMPSGKSRNKHATTLIRLVALLVASAAIGIT